MPEGPGVCAGLADALGKCIKPVDAQVEVEEEAPQTPRPSEPEPEPEVTYRSPNQASKPEEEQTPPPSWVRRSPVAKEERRQAAMALAMAV